MGEKIVAVITQGESDLLDCLKTLNVKTKVLKPDAISKTDMDKFYSIAVIGGVNEEPLMFHPRDRVVIERQIQKGKKIFCEYCYSIGYLYFMPEVISTRYERLVYCAGGMSIDGLKKGDLMEDQCNVRLVPWINTIKKPALLQYVNLNGHNNIKITDDILENFKNRAIWFDRPENILICSFRLANFIKARFSPKYRWKALVKSIFEWLCDESISLESINESYCIYMYNTSDDFEKRLKNCINNAMNWFEQNGIILDKGYNGVLEGMKTEIYPDGRQEVCKMNRGDCIGEISLAYFLKYLMDGDKKALEISDNLMSYYFDIFMVKDEGPYKGMVYWSSEQWYGTYQDEVARALIPQLLKCLYSNNENHIDNCIEILKFLVKTTGTDGTRIFRTENILLSEEKLNKLSTRPGNLPSAWWNGYYLASLLLAYKLTKVKEFADVGIKGLETIMSVYPNTIREWSQTVEMCRLVLPLSWLYWVSGLKKHKEWLYQVVYDLEKFHHSSGAYLEWDEGYKARLRKKKHGNSLEWTECSLLVKNGDPVADLLYSLCWLPIGFIQAYFVTGDDYFKKLWVNISKFFISSQIYSDNKQINGAWARAFDVEFMEVFGSPMDMGWGPWCIESGWTVAEIISGFKMGLLEEKLKRYY